MYLRGMHSEFGAAAPAFSVFVDPDVVAPPPPSSSSNQGNKGALEKRTSEGVADKLAKDPLRYVKNPEKEEKDKSMVRLEEE
jgi:hypothetical protein